MAINLPRPPNPNLFDATNPRAYIDQLDSWFARVIAEIERDSREQSAPARAVFSMKNLPPPTTTLDGAGLTIADLEAFLAGLVDTMVKRGFLRTRAGQE